MDFVIHYSYLIPLLPLLGAAAAGFFGARYLKGNSHWPIWIGVGGSAVLSFVLLFGMLARWHPHQVGVHESGGAAGRASASAGGAPLTAAQGPDQSDEASAAPAQEP